MFLPPFTLFLFTFFFFLLLITTWHIKNYLIYKSIISIIVLLLDLKFYNWKLNHKYLLSIKKTLRLIFFNLNGLLKIYFNYDYNIIFSKPRMSHFIISDATCQDVRNFCSSHLLLFLLLFFPSFFLLLYCMTYKNYLVKK